MKTYNNLFNLLIRQLKNNKTQLKRQELQTAHFMYRKWIACENIILNLAINSRYILK